MYFPSKKDLWFGAVFWGIFLFCSLWYLWDLYHDPSLWPGLVIGGIVLIWFIWLWFGTGYKITDTSLEASCGPFYRKIPMNNIRSVRRGFRLNRMSYILSLDCLEIKYRYGAILVSPRDSLTFINELKQRCPEADFSY